MPPDGLRLPPEPASPTPGARSDPLLSDMSSTRSYAPASTAATLKRRASPSYEDVQVESSRKRLKEDSQDVRAGSNGAEQAAADSIDGEALANELEQELQCACCSALVYRPVIVVPCQHFFCGSCVIMWIRNGGTNCPACRGLSAVVTPSRALQTMVDVLLHHAPDRARPANERMQADEIYRTGVSLRIPSPRQASPEPSIQPRNANYVQPCPHCATGNQYGWVCPQPIADPELDPDRAWHTEDGTPPGHAYCGNCENILALAAPATTTKCDFCQVSFCGIGIPTRCVAAPLLMQHPHGLSDIGDLIQCGEIYDCFDSNTVEVDIMLDYLTAQRLTPKHIYREIVAHIQTQPRQFAPLIELDLFQDVHSVAGGVDPGPNAPRSRICRLCATEVFLWGLRDWWVRERRKGFLEEYVTRRPDCPDGSGCARQKDHGHAKEYNHIIVPHDAPMSSSGSSTGAGLAAMPTTSARAAPLYLPLASSSGSHSILPPFLPPVPPYEAEADLALLSQFSAGASAPASSQDFRDEVDAML